MEHNPSFGHKGDAEPGLSDTSSDTGVQPNKRWLMNKVESVKSKGKKAAIVETLGFIGDVAGRAAGLPLLGVEAAGSALDWVGYGRTEHDDGAEVSRGQKIAKSVGKVALLYTGSVLAQKGIPGIVDHVHDNLNNGVVGVALPLTGKMGAVMGINKLVK